MSFIKIKRKSMMMKDNDDDNIKLNNYIKLANFVLFSLFDHFTFNEPIS